MDIGLTAVLCTGMVCFTLITVVYKWLNSIFPDIQEEEDE